MKAIISAGAMLLFAASISLTVGSKQANAQGPAGVGATAAAQDSSRSLNPISWIKKDKNSDGAGANRSDAEKKLTPMLQSQGVLAANANATDACASFTNLDGCLATLHASHNLNLDFVCLRAGVTGVHSSADMSGCAAAGKDKAQTLNKAIHEIKPDANAKQAVKDAEQQAKDDLRAIGS
jgi:hypothetical protein